MWTRLPEKRGKKKRKNSEMVKRYIIPEEHVFKYVSTRMGTHSWAAFILLFHSGTAGLVITELSSLVQTCLCFLHIALK